MAYESTTVPVERSQGEIRKLLIGFGCERRVSGTVPRRPWLPWLANYAASDWGRVESRPLDAVSPLTCGGLWVLGTGDNAKIPPLSMAVAVHRV
jgi:hypothetical protein